MKTLSSAQEREIVNAALSAVDLVSEGNYTPNGAVEKLARERSWGPDMIRFVAHAFNTGRQQAQMSAGENAAEKFATFELADPREVISAIYTDNEKTAEISDVYLRPAPTVKAVAAAAEKRAYAARKTETPAVVADKFRQHRALKRAEQVARDASAAAYDDFKQAVDRLEAYFNRLPGARLSPAVVYYGADVSMGKTAGAFVQTFLSAKGVRSPEKVASNVFVDQSVEPWSLIADCLATGSRSQEKRAAHVAAVDALDSYIRNEIAPHVAERQPGLLPDVAYYKDADLKLFGLRRETPAETADDSWLDASVKLAATDSELNAALNGLKPVELAEPLRLDLPATVAPVTDPSLLDDLAEKAAADPAKPGEKSDAKTQFDKETERVVDSLNAPDHMAALRGIRAQTMLAELMGRDSIIGGYEPRQVLDAYNQLSEVAPSVAANTVTLQPALRRMLQGSVSTFEAKELGDTEKTLNYTLMAK